MPHHLICLTVDIDPDGLSGKTTDRTRNEFKGFEQIMTLPDLLHEALDRLVPITWFVRIDKQMEDFFGSEFYLIDTYKDFFSSQSLNGSEIAWHPHLYEKRDGRFELPSSDETACGLIKNTFSRIEERGIHFTSFRNGEGWHTNATMNLIRDLNFVTDSTALPGLIKPLPHLLNWEFSKNQPYYPSKNNCQVQETDEDLVEVPINTWFVKAPYDASEKLRYLNPAVTEHIFNESLIYNKEMFTGSNHALNVWTFITHPDELIAKDREDLLHSSSMSSYVSNVRSFTELLENHGHTFEFCTINSASTIWKSR